MKKILIVSIILSLASNNLFATTYYVSNSGNDTVSGLSPTAPWLTINKVNASTFLPGDSILFNRNNTWNERLQVPTAGVIDSNILFGAYGAGNKPIIDVLSSDVNAITCYKSYITFQDLVLKNSTATNLSIAVIGGCYGINVLRVEIFNSGKNALSISKGGSDILIDDVRVITALNNGIYLSGSEFDKLSNVIVENCYVSGVTNNDGIVVHQDGSLHSAGSNFIFRNNYAELCGEQGFDITTGTNVLLLNNISKNNSAGGVVVGHSADSVTIQNHTSLYEPTLPTSAAIKIGGDARNVKLIYSQIIGDGHHLLLIDGDNVEIYNNVFVWDGGGSLFDLSNEIENVIVKNNIFTTLQGSMSRVMRFLTPTRPPDHPTFKFDNNIYYTPDSVVTIYSSSTTTNYSLPNYQTTFGQDSNSFFAKPEFVDLAGSDFHLTSISPAIENGVHVNLNADFDNFFVPYNLFPDIGAFEYSDVCLAPTNLDVEEIGFGGSNPRVNGTWNNTEGTASCEVRGGRISDATAGSSNPQFSNIINTHVISQTNGSNMNFNIALYNNPNVPFVIEKTYGYEVRCQCADASGFSPWSGIFPSSTFVVPAPPVPPVFHAYGKSDLGLNKIQSVYPNPSNGERLTLQIDVNLTENYMIELRDISGRILEKHTFILTKDSSRMELEFNDRLKRGIYLLILTNSSTQESIRFAVE